MIDSNIHVQIIGYAGSGKTTVAELIRTKLFEAGLIVSLKDDLEGVPPLDMRVKALIQRKTQVSIEVINLKC